MLEMITSALSRTSTVDWLLVVAGVLLVLYYVGTKNYNYFEKRGVPSTRHILPFTGDFLKMFIGLKSFPDGQEELYKKGRGYGIFGLFETTKPVVLVRDPELVKVVAIKEFENFMNHRSFASEKIDPLFGKNLFNLKDEAWKDMRVTLSPAFTTTKIKAMLPLISQCAKQMSEHLREQYANGKEGNKKEPLAIDMKDLFTRMANDVIATTAFGVSCDSLKVPDNEFYRMGKLVATFGIWRVLLIFAFFVIPKFIELTKMRVLDKRAADFFDNIVHETIRERQKKGIYRPDVLQLLMQAREGKLKVEKEDAAEIEEEGLSRKKGKELQDDEISAQAVLFFLAGFETVSTALCVTTYALSHNPDVQKRLQQEIDETMTETGGNLTYETIQSMKYLDAVVNEALRQYPPLAVTDRVCTKNITLPAGKTSKPFTITKGTLIQIPIAGLQNDPQYWDKPEKFDPDRFNDTNKHTIKSFTYMPFGIGPRICIGQRFALIEVKLALVHLLHAFTLHPKTKFPLEYARGGGFLPKGGFWCGLTPREVAS